MGPYIATVASIGIAVLTLLHMAWWIRSRFTDKPRAGALSRYPISVALVGMSLSVLSGGLYVFIDASNGPQTVRAIAAASFSLITPSGVPWGLAQTYWTFNLIVNYRDVLARGKPWRELDQDFGDKRKNSRVLDVSAIVIGIVIMVAIWVTFAVLAD